MKRIYVEFTLDSTELLAGSIFLGVPLERLRRNWDAKSAAKVSRLKLKSQSEEQIWKSNTLNLFV